MEDLNLIANLMTREQRPIKKGGFGEIYCVENYDGVTYCLKKIDKNKFQEKCNNEVYTKLFFIDKIYKIV